MMVRELTPSDLPAFFDHCQRHFAESGQNGDLIFHPITDFATQDREEEVAKLVDALHAPLEGGGWQRIWVAEHEGQILGDSVVRASFMNTTQHRCQFALGIERSARGLGLGRRLSEEAIAWCRRQKRFDWLDLWVFAHNAPAIVLYERLGFQKVDIVRDQFRVNGQKIDDLHMCLELT
jgi:GNAT superfamily N-acetyltransferase